MKRIVKEAKTDYNRLLKKNARFSRRSKIEDNFKRNKNNKIYSSIFLSLSLIYFGIAAYIIYNYSFSGWNYALTSILIAINAIIIISIRYSSKNNLKTIMTNIETAMKENFTKAERNQFLRLKKLNTINN